jgi:hypothetical protein
MDDSTNQVSFSSLVARSLLHDDCKQALLTLTKTYQALGSTKELITEIQQRIKDAKENDEDRLRKIILLRYSFPMPKCSI